MIYGMYVISKVSETGSIFFADGTPRKIDFTLSLTALMNHWPRFMAISVNSGIAHR